MTSVSDKKGELKLFLVQESGGSLTGPHSENRVGDQNTGSPGKPVSSIVQVPGESTHSPARTRKPW